MASSDFYWSRVPGFGKMWFLILPRNADSPAGGRSLIGSVARDHQDRFLGATGLFGKNFPEPNILGDAQIILNAIEINRAALGIKPEVEIIREETFPPNFQIEVDKNNALKIDVANFPSLPVSFSIDFSRMSKVTLEFGSGTVKRMMRTDFLSLLKNFLDGDDSKVPNSAGINISKETIVHQILLAKQYSVTFESLVEFKTQTDVAIAKANRDNAGKIMFALDTSTRKKITVQVDDDTEYLIALNDIDWDSL
ncbi:MAG: hypothetical protein HC781_06510 [Leptolyngbyaceae cyanobacterium CSU_1_4]|nr:hypothetical protein [Leptolyngbyaceae cyanobacterium CSU_1_4]